MHHTAYIAYFFLLKIIVHVKGLKVVDLGVSTAKQLALLQIAVLTLSLDPRLVNPNICK